MGDYAKRKEHGRYVDRVQIVEKIVEKQSKPDINMDDLANAVANAIMHQLPSPQIVVQGVNGENVKRIFEDSFDDKGTMEQLASSMIVQRGKKESNFKDLGNVSTTQKDLIDVNKTIDLLSGLDD